MASKTKKGYEGAKGSEDRVHLQIQKDEFDPATGKPMHKPIIHITDPTAYYQFLKYPQGNTIKEVLHLPDGVKSPEEFYKTEAEKEKKADGRNKRN